MLGSFDECKGSASLIQSLLHSLPMTAKIVHETFLLYLVIFFIHKKTQSTHYQKHTQIHRNLPQLKKMALKQNYTPQKRDFGCEKVLFLHPGPLKSLRNTGAEQSSIAHSRLHCVRFFRRKTRLFVGATLLLLSA